MVTLRRLKRGLLPLRQRLASSSAAAGPSGNGGVNVARWPVHALGSAECGAVLAVAREQLQRTGCASFPHFLAPGALQRAASEAVRLAPSAFVTDAEHNAYQAPSPDPALPPTHVRNLPMRTRVASTAFDELAPDSALRALYLWPGLTPFLSAVTGTPVHRLADALGCCSVNVFREGWEHAWHFDEAETTVTLCLQPAAAGGEFEFSPLLRDRDGDLAEHAVRAILERHSSYEPCGGGVSGGGVSGGGVGGDDAPPVSTAPFEAGTLQVFKGRYCLHRVKRTEGPRDRLGNLPQPRVLLPHDAYSMRIANIILYLSTRIRVSHACTRLCRELLVAVLCFAERPGVFNSAAVQKMFWGREKDPLPALDC